MDVEIRESKVHGRGLFAARMFMKWEEIARTPAILVPKQEILYGHTLWPYTFKYGENWLVGLGVVSFANNNDDPNAEIIYNVPAQEILLTAVKTIQANDEIFIWYKKDESYVVAL